MISYSSIVIYSIMRWVAYINDANAFFASGYDFA